MAINKVLIFGAGVLGSLYYYRLQDARKNVTLLARGKHYQALQRDGLVMKDYYATNPVHLKVNAVDRLDPDDAYDLVLVVVRRSQVPGALQILGENKRCPLFLFLGNNPSGFGDYIDRLGKDRVLLGFPSAGGKREGTTVTFLDSSGPGKQRSAITIGEADGRTSPRCREIQEFFETAGIPVHISPNIDSWLKYHVALVSPIVRGLYSCNIDTRALVADGRMLRSVAVAIKECVRALKVLGYPVEPARLKKMANLPTFLVSRLLRRAIGSPEAELVIKAHAVNATDEMDEMDVLYREFSEVLKRAGEGAATPTYDTLVARSIQAMQRA